MKKPNGCEYKCNQSRLTILPSGVIQQVHFRVIEWKFGDKEPLSKHGEEIACWYNWDGSPKEKFKDILIGFCKNLSEHFEAEILPEDIWQIISKNVELKMRADGQVKYLNKISDFGQTTNDPEKIMEYAEECRKECVRTTGAMQNLDEAMKEQEAVERLTQAVHGPPVQFLNTLFGIEKDKK